MNTDQVKGKAQQVVGKVRQEAGELIGNDKLANKGVAEQVKGAVRETWGNVKDAAEKETKAHEAEHHEHAHQTRDHIANKTQDLKERAKEEIYNTRE